ncbi:transcriptional repressor [Microbulbifer flavimaris]|uniref:Transcriptional repressor n=1 Tax=Microbulbifer flavimaris TaxID=1781068 RepID=A0ABX4I489_9GAMM|nr:MULTISPECIES: transcriptional repressor [Microbulbifer]KUJ84769.1 hypothetical protein AVO43_03735 [Microbulbifer sp. ZGT114]PCO06863.1 transcriptional repressor [Microbulbifer flavimaris]
MSDVEIIMQRAEQLCNARGVRLTPRRRLVLNGLVQSEKAVSAYELVSFCKERYEENIPAMSVYRILDFLEKHHLAHKLKLSNKYLVREGFGQNTEDSLLLICEKCGNAQETAIEAGVIADLHQTVMQAGFNLINPKLEINCLCGHCTTQAPEQHTPTK